MSVTKIQVDNGCVENGWQRVQRRYHEKINNMLRLWIFQAIKHINVKHCVTVLILLTLGTIVYYTHYVERSPLIG